MAKSQWRLEPPWQNTRSLRGNIGEFVTTVAPAAVRINVWEVGVHASLSAEPLQMWSRFVPRAEFVHRNLIQDKYPLWCQTFQI